MRLRSFIAATAVVLMLSVGHPVHAADPSSQDAADQSAVAAKKAAGRFGNLPQSVIDPSEANKALAADAVKDKAFSGEAASAAIAAHEAEARGVVEHGMAAQQKSLDALLKDDSSVMRLANIDRDKNKQKDIPPVYRLFASRSLDPGTLKTIVETARDHPNLVVVFRGLLPGEKINHLAKFLMTLIGMPKEGPLPTVVLDPVPFRTSKVTIVPTLEKLDADANVIASVRGIINPRWLDDRIAHGEKGDLGKYGPTVEVSEEDVEAVMQRSLAKMDLAGSAKKGLASFWSRQQVWPLTNAVRDRTRSVDPSVVLTDGITAPDGTVIAYPGQRINPMDVMPFNVVVIVIDARDRAQLEFAAKMVKHLGTTPVSVMTTAETNWQDYQDQVVALGVPLYELKQDIVDRFALEHVPSVVVSGTNKTLEVREYALAVDHKAAGGSDADHNRANR